MKQLLVVAVLVLGSGPAYGEWVPVVQNDTGAMNVYADPSTIRRDGNLVKMWQLADFKTVQSVAGGSFLSSKSLYEYDCTEERMRILALTGLSGHMGSGTVVFTSSNEQKWELVQPDTVGQLLLAVACRKP